VVAEGLKIPEPVEVQIAPEATVLFPDKFIPVASAQIVLSEPASTVGAGAMVTVIRSVTALHNPFPVVVNVSVTDPAEISDGDGEYVAVIAVVFGKKTPFPLVVHIPPVATVVIPFRFTVALFAHTVSSAPVLIFAVGAGFIVAVI
jgi:hypothetical protein